MSTAAMGLALALAGAGAPCVAPRAIEMVYEAPDERVSLRQVVAREARANGLSVELVEAIITVESGWNPWAIRLETKYRYVRNIANHAHENHITMETERALQRMAFGMFQIVGGTARATGYRGPLSALLDPETNIHWGTRYLGTLRQRFPNSTRAQIAAYNGGPGAVRSRGHGSAVRLHFSNQGYVDKVMGAMKGGRHE